MTSLLEGARKLVTRGTEIGSRIEALESAARAARGRLDDAVVDDAQEIAERAAQRLRLSAEHTVVAIAGATGSGKSSTFNQLTGLELSAVGVRRPTTSWASACVWGNDGAEELLSWLGIPPRHQTSRDSMLDTSFGRRRGEFDGLVLLDLPDHDSTEVSHHLEVDRLVQLADLLVWVLDPQKYADAALHDRYLAPLRSHAGVMVVVLNHIDTVPADRRQSMIDDVRRLLDADGLEGVPIFPISAKFGDGLDKLRHEVAKRVATKQITRARLEADLATAAMQLREAGGDWKKRTTTKLADAQVRVLESAFADAAGIPTVVDAVERSTKVRAGRATGWPVVSWVSKLKPDPLKRLHLDLGAKGKELIRTPRTSVPEPTPVQRARIDTEVRQLADEASEGMGGPWADAVRRASTSRLDELSDRLDSVLGATDLGAARLPWWATTVRLLQWLLIVAALTGAIWLGALAVVGYFQLPEVPTPDVQGFPLPTLLLLGGVALGIVLALACKVLVNATARSRAAAADRRLRAGVHEVAAELVVQPIVGELEAHNAVQDGLSRVLG